MDVFYVNFGGGQTLAEGGRREWLSVLTATQGARTSIAICVLL